MDANDDYVFGRNQNGFYSDADAVGQAIYTTLKMYRSEWWEDQQAGLPLFEHILGVSGTPEHIQSVDLLIQDAILGVAGVTGIVSFNSSFDSESRAYSVTNCEVSTKYGNTSVEGVTFG